MLFALTVLPELERLDLSGTAIHDVGALSGIQTLAHLDLSDIPVREVDIAQVNLFVMSNPGLTHLALAGLPVRDLNSFLLYDNGLTPFPGGARAVVGQSAVVSLNLVVGVYDFTLTVTDAPGDSSQASARVEVRDTVPPVVTAELVRVDTDTLDDEDGDGDDDSEDDDSRDDDDWDDGGVFRVVATATDACVGCVTIQADVNGVPVTDGQLVSLEIDEEFEAELEDGLLEIEAPSIVLTVTATDSSGNQATATGRLGNH